MTARELDMMYGEIDTYTEDDMAQFTAGTEWTEPGQGATWGELRDELWSVPDGPICELASNVAFRLSEPFKDTGSDSDDRTNLRLTGAPLTAEDIKRIAEAK